MNWNPRTTASYVFGSVAAVVVSHTPQRVRIRAAVKRAGVWCPVHRYVLPTSLSAREAYVEAVDAPLVLPDVSKAPASVPVDPVEPALGSPPPGGRINLASEEHTCAACGATYPTLECLSCCPACAASTKEVQP
ncbi:MAG: hypothetical protein ACYTAN_01690 [Planctomycetota bacterium]